MSDERNSSEESIEALAGMFPDGRTVDTIKDGATGRLRLICFDGKKYQIEDRISSDGHTFVPPVLDPAAQSAVTLPTQASDYGSTAKLFAQIQEFLATSGVSLEVATKVTYFVFQDWLPEMSLPAPCLIITGPGPESALLLQLLGGVLRRPLRLVEIDSHASRALIQYINPTVLVDARHFTARSLRRLLATSGFRFFAPAGGSCFAKAVYVGADIPLEVPSDFAVHVRLAPSPRGVSLLDEKQLNQVTAELQAKLVDYRLRNVPKVRSSDFDVPDLDLEARTVARGIGRSVVDAPELQHGVRLLLEDRDEDLRSTRWTDPTCVTIEVLLDKSHTPQPDGIFVGKVAEAASALLQARGASIQLKARAVGSVLRRLGFASERNGKGTRILVTTKVIRRIHDLARDYRVAAVEDGIRRCDMCREIFAVADITESSADVHSEQSL